MFTVYNKKQPSRGALKKAALTNFSIFTENTCVGFLFNLVAGFQVYDFIKKRLQQGYFSTKIVKFLKTPILKKICERLLLNNVAPNFSFIYLKTAKQVFL